MIDVLKRLAELDAKNPNMVSENSEVAECGPMGMMGGMEGMSIPEAPKTPATLNVTAGSAEELGNMLTQIMQLAGVHKVEPEHLGIEREPSPLTAEPEMGGEAPHSGSPDSMRGIKDRMNDFDDNEADDEGDREETDEETEEPIPGGIPGVDNTPNDPTKQKPFNPNGFAKQQNSPGGGDVPKDHETRPRDRNQPIATFENLMSEYQQFVSESEGKTMSRAAKGNEKYGKYETESVEDRLKDLDPKNPVNIPAYKRKAASGDSASAAKNTREAFNAGKEQKHAADTTMKHIKNPTQGEKDAAKDIKPGIKGYADRADMLKSAEQRGALKESIDMASLLKLSGLR